MGHLWTAQEFATLLGRQLDGEGSSYGDKRELKAGRRRRSRHRPMGDINVTPMVDVMLVLLIVFMVTAPY